MIAGAILTPPRARPGEVSISTWSYQSLGQSLRALALTGPSSQNFPAANLAVFIPFGVPEPVTVTKLHWGTGSPVAGNLDLGIYDEAGNLLVSTGTTAMSGTNSTQVVDVTDTRLGRGRYYWGLCSDTSAATQKLIALVPAVGIGQGLGLLQQTSCAPPLATNASPATFAAYAQAFLPLVGLQGYRAVGP